MSVFIIGGKEGRGYAKLIRAGHHTRVAGLTSQQPHVSNKGDKQLHTRRDRKRTPNREGTHTEENISNIRKHAIMHNSKSITKALNKNG